MYKRIVLKLSGEALAGEKKGVIFDDSIIWGLIAQIKAVMAKGTQVSLVIGGGNFGEAEVQIPRWIARRQTRLACSQQL